MFAVNARLAGNHVSLRQTGPYPIHRWRFHHPEDPGEGLPAGQLTLSGGRRPLRTCDSRVRPPDGAASSRTRTKARLDPEAPCTCEFSEAGSHVGLLSGPALPPTHQGLDGSRAGCLRLHGHREIWLFSSHHPGGSVVKNLPVKWEMQVPSLGWEDALEEEMANQSSILVWEIPEEAGRLQPMRSQELNTTLHKQPQPHGTKDVNNPPPKGQQRQSPPLEGRPRVPASAFLSRNNFT